uniref:Uncharacterized protein n=1 Tax=Lophocladia kuetzingii TaxID=675577 RepID=A0A1Z1MNT8_9FLOR|nr:hypothetical protein [Lophocladia kuetzingii]ARW67606.1 hypothetical protein [Lophocladia kuetzingii]
MDNSYVLIRIHDIKIIELYYFHYSKFSQYPICFTVAINQLDYMFYLLSLYETFNFVSTKHKLYIGKELFKAIISNSFNQLYIQD